MYVWLYICVIVCMDECTYSFIKLYTTAQSGPVIVVILYHLHWSSQGGIHYSYYENL